MSTWGRIFATIYDPIMSVPERFGMRERRVATVGQARGRVLELGAGTGLNLAHYPTVEELVLTEPEEPMARRLRSRAAQAGLGAQVVEAPAEHLPFPDEHFDSVISTLVLCTVGDLPASLAEIRRVLKPGGRLLFCEHVRSDDPGLAAWQDRMHPFWVRFGHGCHCNRATLPAIQAAGLEVDQVEHGELKGLVPIVKPLIMGSAIRA
ncbi:MAG TPA: class I SAM-dependent methyltransferase [Solirubrobacteraceae bacterium]|nr:class I SAM-dependent methyltransferase [Solirubrobacteraceae bacterium]